MKKPARRLAPVEVISAEAQEEGGWVVALFTDDRRLAGLLGGLLGSEIAVDIETTLTGQPAPDALVLVERKKR